MLEGWPHDEVPFRNLSDVSNLQKLEVLLKGWQEGTIYFRRVSEAEFAMLDAARAATAEEAEVQTAGDVNADSVEAMQWG